MTEAVPVGELLHEEALFGLTDAYSRLDFASPPAYLELVSRVPDSLAGVCKEGVLARARLARARLISSSLGVARPFTNKVEKKCTDLRWAELDRLHSMTRAHPHPLALWGDLGVDALASALDLGRCG